MAMRTFSYFEKSKNQFQLIRHFIHDPTLNDLPQVPDSANVEKQFAKFNRPLKNVLKPSHSFFGNGFFIEYIWGRFSDQKLIEQFFSSRLKSFIEVHRRK